MWTKAKWDPKQHKNRQCDRGSRIDGRRKCAAALLRRLPIHRFSAGSRCSLAIDDDSTDPKQTYEKVASTTTIFVQYS
jgi:hypothetical protein